MDTTTLEKQGFREISDNFWIRLHCQDGICKASSYWFAEDDAAVCVSARFSLDKARRYVARLCKIIGCDKEDVRKTRARRVLLALLASDLNQSSVGHVGDEDDIGICIEGMIGGWRERRAARHKRRDARRRARRNRFKRALNRLAKKVAKNKVLRKLRIGYGKILKGPVGDTVAKVVGGVLQLYGVPRKATEIAIKSYHNRVSDRMDHGGWAGVVERSTQKGKSIKDALKEEGKRHGEAMRDAAKETFVSPKKAVQNLAAKYRSENVSGEFHNWPDDGDE